MHQLDLPRSVQLPELMFVYVCLDLVALCSWQSRGLCVCVSVCVGVRVFVELCYQESFHSCRIAGGQRRPMVLCPTKLSMVTAGYLDLSSQRTCICNGNQAKPETWNRYIHMSEEWQPG